MMESFRWYFQKVFKGCRLFLFCFCLSAANRKESFYTAQCKHKDRKRGGQWLARSSHSRGAALPECSTLQMCALSGAGRCWPVGCGSLSEVVGDLRWMSKAYPLSVKPENATEGMEHPVTVLLLIFQTADEWQCHPRTHHPGGIAMRVMATTQQKPSDQSKQCHKKMLQFNPILREMPLITSQLRREAVEAGATESPWKSERSDALERHLVYLPLRSNLEMELKSQGTDARWKQTGKVL
ncbi:uncharacterized protein LOC107200677 [Parus major]|uniref:uncharacterized protein LOC107200677 n=1 Tax=Parus major TaxID=9157 RepID=UPI0014444FD3|nr:uncharacterized protein LOC107200677 [Parus major]